jgi:hypothetical protein
MSILRHRKWVLVTIVVSALGCVVYFSYPYFLSDRILMWETRAIETGRASTERAQAAAKRFFDTHDLRGRTRDEVISVVGSPTNSNDSIYNFPFYPVEPGTLTYRFDTGTHGWQFDILFGLDGRATSVTHRGIE